jgi:hypothetical protein
MSAKIIILLINVIGGIAVIGSYIVGLAGKANGANILWGGTPANVRSIYTISMLLAAIGYFAFIYFILFKLNLSTVNVAWLSLIFLGILIPSAFWMPLTNMYINNPTTMLWIGIRLVLAIVGLSSILLALFLGSLNASQGGAGLSYGLAVAGSIYFAFHTAVLDMLLWPVFFRS